MKVAIYCRVSTDEQTNENQELVLVEWAKNRGWEVVAIYRETGSAFQHADQKELRRMIEDARHGMFSCVIVKELSRLTRQGPFHQILIVRQLVEAGAEVKSYSEAWLEQGTTPMMREWLIGFVGYLNNEASQKTSERTKAGMQRAAVEGKHIGRPRKNCVSFATCQRTERKPNGCKECSGYLKKVMVKA